MELSGLVLPSVLSRTEPAVLDSGNGNESQRKLHNTLALTCLRFSIFAFHTQRFWVLIKTRLECILVVQKYLLEILDWHTFLSHLNINTWTYVHSQKQWEALWLTNCKYLQVYLWCVAFIATERTDWGSLKHSHQLQPAVFCCCLPTSPSLLPNRWSCLLVQTVADQYLQRNIEWFIITPPGLTWVSWSAVTFKWKENGTEN